LTRYIVIDGTNITRFWFRGTGFQIDCRVCSD